MARCETASLALSRTDSSIHENQRGALRRADRDVGGAQAFAVGEGGVRNDADIDAVLGERAAGQFARAGADQFLRRPGWRRRCGRRGRDARRDRRARRSGRETAPRSPAAPTCDRTASRIRRGCATVVASTDAASLPSARHVNASRTSAATPMPNRAMAIRTGAPSSSARPAVTRIATTTRRCRPARVGAFERRGKRRRRHMPARRRTRVHGPRVRAVGVPPRGSRRIPPSCPMHRHDND